VMSATLRNFSALRRLGRKTFIYFGPSEWIARPFMALKTCLLAPVSPREVLKGRLSVAGGGTEALVGRATSGDPYTAITG